MRAKTPRAKLRVECLETKSPGLRSAERPTSCIPQPNQSSDSSSQRWLGCPVIRPVGIAFAVSRQPFASCWPYPIIQPTVIKRAVRVCLNANSESGRGADLKRYRSWANRAEVVHLAWRTAFLIVASSWMRPPDANLRRGPTRVRRSTGSPSRSRIAPARRADRGTTAISIYWPWLRQRFRPPTDAVRRESI